MEDITARHLPWMYPKEKRVLLLNVMSSPHLSVVLLSGKVSQKAEAAVILS